MARPRWPWATLALLVINVAAFTYQSWGGRNGQRFEEALVHEADLVHQGEWWRLIGSIFLHGYFFHLAANMFFHVVGGRIVEPMLGHARFLALYLLAGLGGALCLQTSQEFTGLGASGAVSGVIGVLLFEATARRQPRGDFLPSRRFLFASGSCLAIDWLLSLACEHFRLGFTIGVRAHAGGLVTGTLLAYVFLPRPVTLPGFGLRRRVAVGLLTLVILGGLAIHAAVVPPVVDPARAAQRQVVLEVERGMFEAAARSWQQLRPLEHRSWRLQGYQIHDGLLLVGSKALAEEVFSKLVESTQAELESRRAAVRRAERNNRDQQANVDGAAQSRADCLLLNDLAWYHAVQGVNLQEALALAHEAIAGLEALLRARPWFLASIDAIWRDRGYCATTRGWILLRMGETRPALQDLREAVELDPSGRSSLYLALACDRLGMENEAREAALDAESGQNDLSVYERTLLAELIDSLGRD